MHSARNGIPPKQTEVQSKKEKKIEEEERSQIVFKVTISLHLLFGKFRRVVTIVHQSEVMMWQYNAVMRLNALTYMAHSHTVLYHAIPYHTFSKRWSYRNGITHSVGSPFIQLTNGFGHHSYVCTCIVSVVCITLWLFLCSGHWNFDLTCGKRGINFNWVWEFANTIVLWCKWICSLVKIQWNIYCFNIEYQHIPHTD